MADDFGFKGEDKPKRSKKVPATTGTESSDVPVRKRSFLDSFVRLFTPTQTPDKGGAAGEGGLGQTTPRGTARDDSELDGNDSPNEYDSGDGNGGRLVVPSAGAVPLSENLLAEHNNLNKIEEEEHEDDDKVNSLVSLGSPSARTRKTQTGTAKSRSVKSLSSPVKLKLTVVEKRKEMDILNFHNMPRAQFWKERRKIPLPPMKQPPAPPSDYDENSWRRDSTATSSYTDNTSRPGSGTRGGRLRERKERLEKEGRAASSTSSANTPRDEQEEKDEREMARARARRQKIIKPKDRVNMFKITYSHDTKAIATLKLDLKIQQSIRKQVAHQMVKDVNGKMVYPKPRPVGPPPPPKS